MNRINKTDESQDKILSLLVILLYFYSVLSWGLIRLLNVLGYIDTSQSNLVLITFNIIIYLSIFSLTILFIINRINLSSIFLPLLFFLSLLTTLLLFQDNREFILTNALKIISNLIIFNYIYIIIRTIKTPYYFILYTYRISLALLISSIVLHFSILKSQSYSMTFSYLMTFIVVTIITYTYFYNNQLTKNYRIFNFIVCLIGITIVIINGSRGALLGILICIIVILTLRFKLKLKAILFLCLGIPFLLIIINLFLPLLYRIILNQGLNSRNLSLLLDSNNFFYMNNRMDYFYNISIIALKNHPFLGLGLFGDRIIEGNYTHNLFIEILLNYGIIFGVIISIYLSVVLIRSIYSQYIHLGWKSLSIIFFSSGFVKLLVSGSYLEDIIFWIMLGVITNANFCKQE